MARWLFAFMVPIFLQAGDVIELARQFSSYQHHYADTLSGRIHYQSVGAPELQTVVLVHGVSGPMHVWDHVVPALSSEFRVIRFDLFGRGFSERLDGDYDLNRYIEQLENLLYHLKITKPVSLVGSSFGAVIASEYALRHPRGVNGLVFIGPAGFPIKVPMLARLRDFPILGDLVFLAFGKRLIEEQNVKYFHDLKPPSEFWVYFKAQLDVAGTTDAIRSTMRKSPVQDYVESYEKVGKLGFPIGVIWGKKDATFPYENHRVLKNKVPSMELVSLDDSAHLPQIEQSGVTNSTLLRFLRSHPQPSAR